MTTSNPGNSKKYVYTGIAGETAGGRVVKSGLYRMTEGDWEWESLANGLPEEPAIRAIAVHPHNPEVVYAGTQSGPYRTTDHGDHWEKVNVPDHALPVWSMLYHPGDPNVMFAGYENSEIYRSEDAGETWRQIPISVRFPDVTTTPQSNLAKRVLMMAASAGNPDALYGALEVGGIIRTLDGGDHWENLSHGQYLNDDYVDMHGVHISALHPGTIITICRAGMFRSTDWGDHWLRVPIEPMNEKGQTYCRSIRQVPGDPTSIWVMAGANFQSDEGAIFHSDDGGTNWERKDIGIQLESTMYGVAFDQRQPSRMYCISQAGQVLGSQDGGQSWSSHNMPEGLDQVYCLAVG